MNGCRLLVPDGSLQQVVHQLLAEAGIPVSYPGDCSYRGLIGNERLFPPPFNVATRMRPWDMPRLIAHSKAELAFTGEDLVWEANCEGRVTILERYPLSHHGVVAASLSWSWLYRADHRLPKLVIFGPSTKF